MKMDSPSDIQTGLPVILSFIKPIEEIVLVLNGHATVYTNDSPQLNRILPKVTVALCYGKISHLKDMKTLKMIQAATAGVDALPWKDIPEYVTVCGNPGSNADAVAEHAWSLILGQAHNLHIHIPNLKNGIFDMSPGISILTGKTIGIIGLGSVGCRIAEIARAFQMRVMAITKSGRSGFSCDFIGDPEDVDHVLGQSDVIVLSVPLTNSTKRMIDLRRLKLLKETCIFVNVGRAELVNREDLIMFLERNPKFRVATDVWWNVAEDYPKDAILMKYPNSLGTPYVAGGLGNSQVMKTMMRAAAINIARFLTGENPHNIVQRSEYV
jgi:phosphoglycerate dehydrogenase-like enzyme